MKILNITSITELRGGDVQMYTVYNLLKSKKDLAQYILCPENSVLAEICKKENAAFFTYKKNKLKLINLIIAIVKICKKESISVVHIHDSSALNAALIAMKFLKKSTKLILSRKRNNRIKNKYLNRYKYSHPSIKKIICVSKAVENIFENIIQNKERLLTIYDAIDVAKFAQKENTYLLHQEFNFSPESRIVGNIAGLTSQKDIFTFIDTAREIMDKKPIELSIKFVIIGDGPLRSELENYVAIKNLKEDLFFMGFRDNVQELLPEFDIFLLTSLTEGLPLTIYEAFATKIPVVATNAGGIGEVVKNGKTGFIANLKDTENLAKGVLRLLNDKQLSETIKTNAFELVSKNHDLSVMKQNYYSLYSSLK